MVELGISESAIEQAALAWLESLGWQVLSGPDIAPGETAAERRDFSQIVLEQRLRDTLARLNPSLTAETLEDAFRKLTHPEGATLEARNRAIHRMFIDGVNVEYRTKDGTIRGAQARIIDFRDIENNDWLTVNQFSIIEDKNNRRPDIVLFLNGLPLVVIELKNAADENATIWTAFQQIQTYKQQIPSVFTFNEALVVSDGIHARIGTITADKEWFLPWRTIEGDTVAADSLPQLQVMIQGVFDKRRFLDLIHYFIAFEDNGSGNLIKKMAGYHQFHAVNVAVEETIRASMVKESTTKVREEQGTYLARMSKGGQPADRRIGVVWHTQGSGKSLTMAFFTGRIILHPQMENPTVVVIT